VNPERPITNIDSKTGRSRTGQVECLGTLTYAALHTLSIPVFTIHMRVQTAEHTFLQYSKSIMEMCNKKS